MKFEPFLLYWRINRKCSPQTIRSYKNDLKHFEAFAYEHGVRRMTQVTHAVISDYVEYMQKKDNPRFDRAGLADSTIERRLAALSTFIEYLRATTNPTLRNPIRDFTYRWAKNDQPKPAEEVSLSTVLGHVSNLRDRVLIVLFLATGLRVSEMHQLNRDTIQFFSEIDESGQEVLGGTGEVVGKGNKKRRFYVDEATLELYGEYLETRDDTNPALFLSERKKRLSVRAIQHMLRTWCKKAGVPPIRVHQLRHSFATRLANAHINSMVLKDLLGHKSLTTTQRYSKLNDSTISQGYFSAMEFINQTSDVSGAQQ